MMQSNHLILFLPFSSCPQSFPASGSFPMSWLFISSSQRFQDLASSSVFLMNIYDCFPLGSTQPSVQFSHSVVSNSLRPHEPQHARPSCPLQTPRAYPNSCPLSWWCHLTISSSVVPFSSCLKSFEHQDLFKWVSSSHQVARVLELQLQHQSLQWTPRTDLL